MKDEGDNEVTLTKTGIAWESDKKYKFQNPEVPAKYNGNLTLCKIFYKLESISCGNFLRHTYSLINYYTPACTVESHALLNCIYTKVVGF